MRKHSVGSAKLASVSIFALLNAGAPAWADVSGTLNFWTATSRIEQLESGAIQGTVIFDDNGTGGGRRRGSLNLVTNLGLGHCEAQSECNQRALERGLPYPGDGSGSGWFHYCVAAATDEGVPHKKKSCWTRPGQDDFGGFGIRPPTDPTTGQIIGFPPGTFAFARSPYNIPYHYFGEVRYLDNDARDWTTLVCLSGGTDRDGNVVGNLFGCLQQIPGAYIYVVDTPIEVKKGH